MLQVHPFVVHFPIALLTVGLGFDLLAGALRSPSLAHAGWWCHLAGILALLGAALTGLLAEAAAVVEGPAGPLLHTHKSLGLTATAAFVLLLLWRIRLRARLPAPGPLPLPYLIAAAGAALLLLYGAWLGGEMVYRWGVGVEGLHRP